MFRYYLFASCAKSVGDLMISSSAGIMLTPEQIRERLNEGFVAVKAMLPHIPHMTASIELPGQGAVIIETSVDVSGVLESSGLHVINFGSPRKFAPGATCLFYVHATILRSAEYWDRNRRNILCARQKEIDRLMREQFGAEPGPEDFTYFIGDDLGTRWTTQKLGRGELRVRQLKQIEEVITGEGISAEFGFRYVGAHIKNFGKGR